MLSTQASLAGDLEQALAGIMTPTGEPHVNSYGKEETIHTQGMPEPTADTFAAHCYDQTHAC
jgi:hypothetical protein